MNAPVTFCAAALLLAGAALLCVTPAGREAAGDGSPADPAATVDVVTANNQFAVSLYGSLRNRSGNLFFSPYSLSSALSMMYAGARGETAAQMAQVLQLPRDHEKLHPASGALMRQLNAEGKASGYQLSIVNALWGQQGESFLPGFLTTIQSHYGTGLREVDFASHAEGARQSINTWIERQTLHKITDLVKPGTLDSNTVLVLTNAAYFNGAWARPFRKDWTKDADFALTPRRKARVPMMSQAGMFRYLDEKEFQAVELPYRDSELTMLVLLPKQPDGLAELEKSLSARQLSG